MSHDRAGGSRRAVVSTTISRSVFQFYGDIIAELGARGYEVHVVTSPGPEVPLLRARGIKVHEIGMRRQIALLADARALFSWVMLLRSLKPALVFAGTPKAGLLGMVASALVRIPNRSYFLQGLRLEGVQGPRAILLSGMEWLTSVCSHSIIAVSPSLARAFRKRRLNAGRPVSIPHNGSSHGVDSEFFKPGQCPQDVRSAVGLLVDSPTVVFLGRITRDKGLGVLCRALDEVRNRGINVQLLALGALDEADSALSSEMVLTGRPWARIVEHVQDVRPYLEASDLLVLPTLREGFPNVVLEAAAMGIPSITTTATGARDSVIDGVTGLLVPVGQVHTLADAILRLVQNDAERSQMGQAARVRVVSQFQPKDVARAIVSAVEDI